MMLCEKLLAFEGFKISSDPVLTKHIIVVTKVPADFVGSALGESERNTKGILTTTEGKVLLIDEAYGLYPGGKAVGNTVDPYKTAVIDTLVAEVQSKPGEDRCVLLLGYKEQMTEMLENSNPGLARRFPINEAFYFEDFNDRELKEILDLRLQKQGLEATEEAKNVALELLRRARDLPNFGNAGDIERRKASKRDVHSWIQRRADRTSCSYLRTLMRILIGLQNPLIAVESSLRILWVVRSL
jgi:hypothetical protein